MRTALSMLAVLVLCATSLEAQWLSDARLDEEAMVLQDVELPTAYPARPALPTAQEEPAAAAAIGLAPSRHAVHRLYGAAGGAVIGGWVGFFTSQVLRSDWEKTSNSDFVDHRIRFTAGGAIVGALAGFLLIAADQR